MSAAIPRWFEHELSIAITAFGLAVVKRIPHDRMPEGAAAAVTGDATLIGLDDFRVRGCGFFGHGDFVALPLQCRGPN